jgi:hypothetical protein
MSFTQMGIFAISAYPYSFKLFWSPVVDSVYSSAFGRRKSWIVPIQLARCVRVLWACPRARTPPARPPHGCRARARLLPRGSCRGVCGGVASPRPLPQAGGRPSPPPHQRLRAGSHPPGLLPAIAPQPNPARSPARPLPPRQNSAALLVASAGWIEARLAAGDVVALTSLFFAFVLLAATQAGLGRRPPLHGAPKASASAAVGTQNTKTAPECRALCGPRPPLKSGVDSPCLTTPPRGKTPGLAPKPAPEARPKPAPEPAHPPPKRTSPSTAGR